MDPARWGDLESFVRHLNGAVKTLALYPATHPATVKVQHAVVEALARLLGQQESTQVGLTEDTLVVEGSPWVGPGEQVNALRDRLRTHGVGTVTFLRGADLTDVRSLLDVLGMDPNALAAQGGAGQALALRPTRHLRVTSAMAAAEEAPPGGLDPRQVLAVYTEAMEAARALMRKVGLGELPPAAEIRPAIDRLVDAVVRDKHAILALTLLKSYDEYLFNHSVNVGILTIALSHHLGLDPEVLREVGFGAFLHDLGKVNWPKSLYWKPAALSPEEWEVVRRHPLEGCQFVERMHGSAIAQAIVLEHHVRFDLGEGSYPVLPAGQEPSFFGRLACVADGYDAMTTYRPYRQAMEPSWAIASIKTLSGTMYHPKLVDAFAQMLGTYPVGTLVRLNTRELAVVVRPEADPARPRVRLVTDANGAFLGRGPEIDLTKDYARSILIPLDPSTKNIDVARLLTGSA